MEIPTRLLGYLERNTRLAAMLHTTEHDTFVMSGAAVTDAGALAQMDVPGHETCVEVGKVRRRWLMKLLQGDDFNDIFALSTGRRFTWS